MAGQNLNKNSQGTNGRDNRYLPRWEVKNRVLYSLEKEGGFVRIREGSSKDLSCAGACLVTNESLEINQKIKLSVYLAKDILVELQGRIVWCNSSSDGYLIGISFVETPVETQDLLLNYAFEIRKEDLVKHWFKGWNNN